MRTATLILQISNPDALIVPVDRFEGMFIDVVDDHLIVSYVDSVIYRRLLVLLLGFILPKEGFKVRRRHVTSSFKDKHAVAADDRFNSNIENQIRWVQDFPDQAKSEYIQVKGLIQFNEGQKKGGPQHENVG